MAHRGFRLLVIGIGIVAKREKRLFAEPAFAAGDGERNHHAVALFELGDGAADFFDDSHRLVAQDVATFHRRHQSVVKMQIASANGGGGYADDDIIRSLDPRIGNGFAANVFLTMPYKCFHALGSGRYCTRESLIGDLA